MVDRFSEKTGRSVEIGPDVVPYLTTVTFHEDLREFNALIEAACAQLDCDGVLEARHIDRVKNGLTEEAEPESGYTLREQVEGFEKRLIESALKSVNENRLDAARQLGLPKRTLADKCRKYGL